MGGGSLPYVPLYFITSTEDDMPTTPREFRRLIEDTQDDMRNQYDDAPFCEIAHQEFGIPETLLEDDQREPILDQFKHMGVSLPDDSIKLTREHREFHDAMRRIVVGFSADGADAVQMLSAGLAVGRRLGMAEAAGLISSDHSDDWWDTDDPGTTGP